MIVESHRTGADLPPRVLVRTYARMPQTQWDAALPAYAPETLERLADRGVVLVLDGEALAGDGLSLSHAQVGHGQGDAGAIGRPSAKVEGDDARVGDGQRLDQAVAVVRTKLAAEPLLLEFVTYRLAPLLAMPKGALNRASDPVPSVEPVAPA